MSEQTRRRDDMGSTTNQAAMSEIEALRQCRDTDHDQTRFNRTQAAVLELARQVQEVRQWTHDHAAFHPPQPEATAPHDGVEERAALDDLRERGKAAAREWFAKCQIPRDTTWMSRMIAFGNAFASVEVRRRATADVEEAVEDEQVRWQKRIDVLVFEKCPDRDGSGCDSGDPLDLTMTELRQAFGHLEQRAEVAEKRAGEWQEKCETMQTAMRYAVACIDPDDRVPTVNARERLLRTLSECFPTPAPSKPDEAKPTPERATERGTAQPPKVGNDVEREVAEDYAQWSRQKYVIHEEEDTAPNAAPAFDGRWREVEQELPPQGQRVLVVANSWQLISFGTLSEDEDEKPLWLGIAGGRFATAVTHWMPLPPKPDAAGRAGRGEGRQMDHDEKPSTLPCPFCGYSNTRVDIIRDSGFGQYAEVSCQICGATVAGIGVMVPEDGGPADELTASAIQSWNTRTPPRSEEHGPDAGRGEGA